MADIRTWDGVTAGNNNDPAPDGAPENMAPSGANDTMREIMRAVRKQWGQAQWFDFGDGAATIRKDGATISLTGTHTATYETGRRIRILDTVGTLHGTISDQSFSSGTQVAITFDSGSLTATVTAVELGILSVTNPSVPVDTVYDEVDVASATTTDIGAAASLHVQITGTTTITGLGMAAEGVWRLVRFAGALTLTHNATSLILPGGANITTAAGDSMLAVSLGSGNWRVAFYTVAAMEPYQEGTWTPTVASTGGGTAGGYTLQAGRYTRIGRIVHAQFSVTLSSKTGLNAGNVSVAGLPFAAANVDVTWAASIGNIEQVNFGTIETLMLRAAPGGSQMFLAYAVDSGGSSPITVAEIEDTFRLSGAITYEAA